MQKCHHVCIIVYIVKSCHLWCHLPSGRATATALSPPGICSKEKFRQMLPSIKCTRHYQILPQDIDCACATRIMDILYPRLIPAFCYFSSCTGCGLSCHCHGNGQPNLLQASARCLVYILKCVRLVLHCQIRMSGDKLMQFVFHWNVDHQHVTQKTGHIL